MATQSICSVPGCGKPFLARGYCRRHYTRWHDGVPLDGPAPRQPRPTCSIDGCVKPAKGKDGLCGMHHSRQGRHGDPNITLRAPRHEPTRYFREVVLPYDGRDCLIWPYARDNNGYAVMALDGHDIAVHRAACIEVNGPPPTPEHQAAHNCGNGAGGCCNPRHQRWATPKENNADKIWHGTNSKKLSVAQVMTIRSLDGQKTAAEIAAEYGVHVNTISCILKGESWAALFRA